MGLTGKLYPEDCPPIFQCTCAEYMCRKYPISMGSLLPAITTKVQATFTPRMVGLAVSYRPPLVGLLLPGAARTHLIAIRRLPPSLSTPAPLPGMSPVLILVQNHSTTNSASNILYFIFVTLSANPTGLVVRGVSLVTILVFHTIYCTTDVIFVPGIGPSFSNPLTMEP